MTLTDEINRLFDQLVRDPWSRPQPLRPAAMAGRQTYIDLEMPVAGQLGNISVSLHGRELTVRARRRSVASGSTAATGAAEELERTFVLPEEAEVSAIEARVADEVLHVRVYLRSGAS